MRVLRLACTLAGVAAIPVHDIASHSPGEVTPVNESPELHLSKSNVPTVPKDEPAELLRFGLHRPVREAFVISEEVRAPETRRCWMVRAASRRGVI